VDQGIPSDADQKARADMRGVAAKPERWKSPFGGWKKTCI
jgi:hypothetical protein